MVDIIYTIPGEQGSHGFDISVYPNKDQLPPIDFAKKLFSDDFGTTIPFPENIISDSTEYAFGEYKATRLKLPSINGYFSLYLENKEKMFVIENLYNIGEMPEVFDGYGNEETNKVFNQILSTFYIY